MTSGPDTGLRVQGLCTGYGRVQVVTDLSLRLLPGEEVALLGRNGVGKTTSLAAIAGLRYGPTRGTVKIGERDVSRSTPNEILKAGVGLVPEGHRIFHEMSVMENLRLGAFSRRRSGRKELKSDLDRVWELFPPLLRFSDKITGALSGGQQQMVAIGQALMSRPKFLLLDEPAAGLAPTLVDEIYETLHRLVCDGLGLLVVEQSIERALERSQRYYVMESGTIAAEGVSSAGQVDVINPIVLGAGSVPVDTAP